MSKRNLFVLGLALTLAWSALSWIFIRSVANTLIAAAGFFIGWNMTDAINLARKQFFTTAAPAAKEKH